MAMRWSVVSCPVPDMERALDFYPDVVGLEILSESPYWSEFQAGGVRIALHLGAEETQRGGWTPCQETDDLDLLRARLEAAGVECDADGNRLQALQPRA